MSINFLDEIVVICGPMYSGKSYLMISSLDRLKHAKISFLVFKPDMDRFNSVISTRFENLSIPAISIDIKKPFDILKHIDLKNIKLPMVVAIDEAQFFSSEIFDVVKQLNENGIKVWISGLELDAWGAPFGPMPQLLSLATRVIKRRAVCSHCGQEAERTASKVPKVGESNVVVDGKDFFPLCCRCVVKI